MSSETEPTDERQERIDEVCETLELPDEVRETASAIYTRVYEDDLYHGRPSEVILSGVIYAASRAVGHAINPSTVANELRVSRESVLGTSRHFMKNIDFDFQPITPEPYVEEYVESLNLSEDIYKKSLDVIDSSKESDCHAGKSPTGFAAGAVYAAAKLLNRDVTQQDISRVSDVSTVTIRNRYKEQLDHYQTAD